MLDLLNTLKRRKDSGFTIVEVMIVLAIAGLIILVVFLAVPALQRSSRNTQRSNDASLIGAGVNECLNNRNGVLASCGFAPGTIAQLDPAYIDTTKLRQLVTVNIGTTMPSDTESANIAFKKKCNADGSGVVAGGSRSVALLYNAETTSGGNLPRCQEL